jgi:hypothetical protein
MEIIECFYFLRRNGKCVYYFKGIFFKQKNTKQTIAVLIRA